MQHGSHPLAPVPTSASLCAQMFTQDALELTSPGMVHAATLVHDQNRPKIVYRRIPASDIGLLSALQGYHFSEAEGGDGASLYEREYLPVLTKAGQRW